MPPNTNGASGYDHVETCRNADGLIAIITRRKKLNGEYTVALYKEFERNGETEKTAFLSRRHIDGAIELLKIAGEKIDRAMDADKASARAARR